MALLQRLSRGRGARQFGGARMEADESYFGRRAKEERVAAMKSGDARARQAHLKMASTYDKRAAADAPSGQHLDGDIFDNG